MTNPSHAAELSPEDRALLAGDVPPGGAAEPAPPPPKPDYEAMVLAIRDRSRPAREAAARERTERQRRLDGLRAERKADHALAALDRRFGRFDADRPDHRTVVRWCIQVSRGHRGGLVLAGAVGTGKTHQAVAAFRYLVGHHRIVPAVAVSVPALLDGLRPGREPVETLEACESARLLLLDDLAAERHTDWTGETLYRLIDARYARNLPTIITTNATGDMIRGTLGDRVASRLNGLGWLVVLDGPDRRAPSTGG